MIGEDATRILDFWEAIETVYPLPDTWAQTSLICHQLSKGQTVQMATKGQSWKTEPIEAFMPATYKPVVKHVDPPQSAEDQCATLDKVLG